MSQQNEIVSALLNNEATLRELNELKSRLQSIESNQDGGAGDAVKAGEAKAIADENEGDEEELDEAASDKAVLEGEQLGPKGPTASAFKSKTDSDNLPIKSVKFLDHHQISSHEPSTKVHEHTENIDDDSSTSSTQAIAFQGHARVFFQARHHRTSTQITCPPDSSASQDTYLYIRMISMSNTLYITSSPDPKAPALIEIPMKYYYAHKVPSSHSGAALFLKNDSRKLRKFIFRFEFRNSTVHQPPARFLQFVRSGNAAKKSMRSLDKVKKAFQVRGKEERKEVSRENKKRSQDAFAAYLGSLDELLRECDDLAEQFVKTFNDKNEEMEEEEYRIAQLKSGGLMNAPSRRKSKPLPPYWGSGFNRQIVEDDDGDDEEDDNSEDDDEDDYYEEDDDDDETFFDKVQVSTEQTLETLFHHIVK
ncbi:hypothetical protein ACHAXN_001997 [Cyclotella atomus]